MKREYSTWYESCFDTKIEKKEKNTYLCNDKIPLAMILSCVCVYTHAHIDHMFILI